jgi:hypothetical protein
MGRNALNCIGIILALGQIFQRLCRARYSLLLLQLLIAQSAAAHTLTLPGHVQPIRDRPYHVSADLCGPALTAEIDRAAAIWNFYAPARLKRLEGPLPPRPERFVSVTCQDGTYFADTLGKPATLDGATYWRYQDWQLRSADIVFNTSFYVPRHCSRLHEFGHALGLDHSAVPGAAMGADVDCEYLAADDLVGIAAVFNVAPNCTPYVSEDFTVYLPHVAGEQLELRPIVPGFLAAGFYESGRSASPPAAWQCQLRATSTSIEGSFYHRGKVFSVRLERLSGGWAVRSAAPL